MIEYSINNKNRYLFTAFKGCFVLDDQDRLLSFGGSILTAVLAADAAELSWDDAWRIEGELIKRMMMKREGEK